MKLNLSRFFQSSLNVFIFRRLHPFIGHYYMQALGRLYHCFARRERRLIEDNIRDLLAGSDEARIRRVTRESFRGLYLHYYEKMISAFRSYRYVKRLIETRFRVEGLDLVASAIARGKGAIVCTAHFGGLEFIPWVIGLNGFPIDIIGECATRRLRRAFEEKLSHGNARLYINNDGSNVFFQALRTLAENRVLMTQCDEVDAWHKRRSRTIPLFGKELYFDNTLDFLAKRSAAPVVAVFLKRTGFLRYHVVFEDVSCRRQPESVAREAMSLWEKYVTRYPEQWYQWKKWAAMKAA